MDGGASGSHEGEQRFDAVDRVEEEVWRSGLVGAWAPCGCTDDVADLVVPDEFDQVRTETRGGTGEAFHVMTLCQFCDRDTLGKVACKGLVDEDRFTRFERFAGFFEVDAAVNAFEEDDIDFCGEGGDGVNDLDAHLADLFSEVRDPVRTCGEIGSAGVSGGHGDPCEVAIGFGIVEELGESGHVGGVETDDPSFQGLQGLLGMGEEQGGECGDDRHHEVFGEEGHGSLSAKDGPRSWAVLLWDHSRVGIGNASHRANALRACMVAM